MSYEVHNFQNGEKLYASDLNEMDAQIAANEAAAAAVTPAVVEQMLSQLTLSSDGNYIILSVGNREVTEVALPDTGSIIPAEELTVTSGASVNMEVGSTSQITYSLQPSDTNQRVRFLSTDLAVATVTSNGLISALDVGRASINVMAGRLRQAVALTARKTLAPVWKPGYTWISEGTATSNKPCLRTIIGTGKRLAIFPDANNQLRVKAGQTFSVTMAAGLFLQFVFAIYPGNDFAYEVDYSGNPAVTGCTWESLISENTHNSFSFTPTRDCYIGLLIAPNVTDESEITQQYADNFNSLGDAVCMLLPRSST